MVNLNLDNVFKYTLFFDVTHVTPYIWTSGQIQLGKGTLGEKVMNVRNFGPSVLLKVLKNLKQDKKS